MGYLAPVGWAGVATKRDLDALQVLMKHDLDARNVLFEIAGVGVVAAIARSWTGQGAKGTAITTA